MRKSEVISGQKSEVSDELFVSNEASRFGDKKSISAFQFFISGILRTSCILLCTLYLLLCTSHSFSQSISSSLDRNKILIGEQVSLQLKADINEANYSLVSWYNIPDSANNIEVVNRGNIDTVETNGIQSLIQTITITSFDSGIWKLPDLQIVVQNKAGKQSIFKTDSLTLQVLPVDVSNLQDYHDIKSVIQVQAQNNWLKPLLISLAALIIVLLFLWWFFKKRKKKIVLVKKSIINGSPFDWAMQELDNLSKQNVSDKEQTKLFYIKLDEVYRTYLDEQMNFGATQMTSDEVMIKLKIYLNKEEIRTKFYQTMRLVDAVKFAKYLPATDKNREAVSHTRDCIKYLEETISQMKKNNAY